MGREQNTSPSRGSGYQVINDLFDRQQDFIVVGLCGKTGSGVSTTAEILNKEFEELHLNTEPPAAWTDYERHEYRLLYNYAKKELELLLSGQDPRLDHGQSFGEDSGCVYPISVRIGECR